MSRTMPNIVTTFSDMARRARERYVQVSPDTARKIARLLTEAYGCKVTEHYRGNGVEYHIGDERLMFFKPLCGWSARVA